MRSIAILWIGLCLAGCATARQSQGLSGGYIYSQIRLDVFELENLGSGRRSTQTAVPFALLHGAQLTLDHGYRYFIVIGRRRDGVPSRIKCFKKQPTGHGGYYDASDICQTLGSKYRVQCQG